MTKQHLIPLLLLLAHPLPATAAVYQWVDENGVTVYSQTPPLSGDARKITTQSVPENTVAKSKLHELRQKADDLREDRMLKKEDKAKEREEALRKKSNCEAARQNLTNLQGLGRRLYGGKRLTEEERQQKIEEAQKQIKENCSK